MTSFVKHLANKINWNWNWQGKTVKGEFPSVYPYAAIVSLLEKRHGVRMHLRMLKRELKNRPWKLRPVFFQLLRYSHTHVKLVKYKCVSYVKFKRQWKSTFISIFLNTKLRNMQHQTFSHRILLKEKNLNVLLRTIYSVLLFLFFFRYSKLSCELKTVYGITDKSNGVGVVLSM